MANKQTDRNFWFIFWLAIIMGFMMMGTIISVMGDNARLAGRLNWYEQRYVGPVPWDGID